MNFLALCLRMRLVMMRFCGGTEGILFLCFNNHSYWLSVPTVFVSTLLYENMISLLILETSSILMPCYQCVDSHYHYLEINDKHTKHISRTSRIEIRRLHLSTFHNEDVI